MPHLPYASDDADEFLHPVEGWLLIDHTVAFDSWILWRHVLPANLPDRALLDRRAAVLIASLAARLHAVHQRLPGYAGLDDSPFRFTRWWNPHSTDPASRDGSCCVFRIEGQSSQQVLEACLSLRLDHLALTPLSQELIRAELTNTDPASLDQSALPCGRSLRKARRRTPRNPL